MEISGISDEEEQEVAMSAISVSSNVLLSDVSGFSSSEENEDEDESVHMIDWFICSESVTNGSQDIWIEGTHLEKDEPWATSLIVKRISTLTVATESGSIYVLHGQCDTKKSIENGFSSLSAPVFVNGFPKGWKKFLKIVELPKSNLKKLSKPTILSKSLPKNQKKNKIIGNVLLGNVKPKSKVKQKRKVEEMKLKSNGKIIGNVLLGPQMLKRLPIRKKRSLPTKVTSRKKKLNNKAVENLINKEENGIENILDLKVRWTREERAIFNQSREEISLNPKLKENKDIWKEISQKVFTKTPQQCFEYFYSENVEDQKKTKKPEKISLKDEKLARKGTAKFRKQIREKWQEEEIEKAQKKKINRESYKFDIDESLEKELNLILTPPKLKKLEQEVEEKPKIKRTSLKLNVDAYILQVKKERKRNVKKNKEFKPIVGIKKQVNETKRVRVKGGSAVLKENGQVEVHINEKAFEVDESDEESDSKSSGEGSD